ncbi:hypothetical protein A176_003122 [Myxococcus hansupus]|uniref:Uncharacterized protein n=1 Tax=Pseudomyxococcus hansupus TaxID=1297742 RepID=A0A0H4WXZ2_9BACT|nr:Ig-like domain-containing protein [Myxococcus hansupus]AKQ66210.1 hypothetical protein A176_003122 [Myxococcus hansupus]
MLLVDLKRGLALVALVAGLVVAGSAQAQSRVATAFPLTPLRPGTTALDLGLSVEGDARQIRVAVKATSASSGTVVDVRDLVVNRDLAGAVPFHVRVPLRRELPSDAVVEVEASPTEGGTGTPLIAQFDLTQAPPVVPAGSVRVNASQDLSHLVVSVQAQGPVASAELTLVGASVEALRRVQGSLSDAESVAFASVRRLMSRPREQNSGQIDFVVPMLNGTQVPADGVVVVDVAVQDPYGRVVNTSAVEFTSGRAFDPLVGISLSPSPLLLSGGYGSSVPVQVTGHFSLAGDVNLSGALQGVVYASSDASIFVVSPEGVVQARNDGTATLTATFAGVTETAVVVVDSDADLVGVQLLPLQPTVERVGGTLALRLEGILSDPAAPTGERRVDLTAGSLGTVWTSEASDVATVGQDGRVTGLRPGVARIRAVHDAFNASIDVAVRDGAPTIRIAAPSTVTAGTSFDFHATATDDISVSYVEFLVNGVPAGRDMEAPYSMRIQAPPYGGATMSLSAAVVDSGGQRVEAPVVKVRVAGVAAPSTQPVVIEAPTPGSLLVQGLPQVLRVTSGAWTGGGLSTEDFQVVRYYVDDVFAGSVDLPRVEIRRHPNTGDIIPVPLWELTFTPRSGTAGTSLAIRVEALDRGGALVRSDTLLVRVVRDTPPLLSVEQPQTATADAVAGTPFRVTGTVSDDALAFGTQVSLRVDGTTVDAVRVARGGTGGTASGSERFNLAWTPARTDVGRARRLELVATDSAGNVASRLFTVTAKANAAPHIAILSPASSLVLVGGSQVRLTASVTDDTPDPVEVRWLVGESVVGRSSVPPYNVAYTLPSVTASTELTVVAEARDSAGNTARTQVKFFAVPDTKAPAVSFVVPRNNVSVPRTSDLLVTVAGLDDVAVSKVEILLNGTVVFTDNAPGTQGGVRGSFVTHTVLTAAQLGTAATHTLEANAYDSSNNVGVAPKVTVNTTDDAKPSVAFAPSTPTEATVGTDIHVEVLATDDVGVTSVELLVNGVSKGTAVVAPYRFSFTVDGPPGTVRLEARARDQASESTAEAFLTVVPDTRKPLVTFRAPLLGAPVFAGRPLSVEVAAADDVKVARVELFAPHSLGALTQGTEENLYHVYRWSLPATAIPTEGKLKLRAVATDSSGLTAERELEVAVVEDLPPVVTLTSPASGTIYKEGEDVRIVATVGDDDGIIGMIGLSGGQRQGVLPETGPVIPISAQQSFTVWAPIISQGALPTVGVEVRDTAGQTGKAEVHLSVRADTEAPTAELLAPAAPSNGGPFSVRFNGALGVRVAVQDDVRVAKVEVELAAQDGTRVPLVGADTLLSAKDSRYEETRVPNPLAPGEILISRRFFASFEGTVKLQGVAAGQYVLRARAFDPAGNATPTQDLALEIVEAQDSEAPRVTMRFQGTPSDKSCVAGSQITLHVDVTDDGTIQTFSAEADNAPLEVTGFTPGPRVSRTWDLTLPALGTFGSRTYTAKAQATDAVGRTTHASVSCELVADVPAVVRWVQPASGGGLIEEASQAAVVEVEEDTGIGAAWLLATTVAPVNFTGEGRFLLPTSGASGNAYGSAIRLEFGPAQAFAVTAGPTALEVSTPATGVVTGEPRRLILTAEPEAATGLKAEVRYQFTVTPGMEGNASVQSFIARHPGGVRQVDLSTAPHQADLTFPSGLVVEDVRVAFLAQPGTNATSAVSDVGIRYENQFVQVRAGAGGERMTAQPWAMTVTPGKSTPVRTDYRLPAGWSPSPVTLSAVVRDLAGAVTLRSQQVAAVPDTQGPEVRISQPIAGSSVVAGMPFTVRVQVRDAVEVRRVELLVDGAPRGTREGRDLTDVGFPISIPAPTAGVPIAITAIAVDQAGNASVSQPLYLDVHEDRPPQVALRRLRYDLTPQGGGLHNISETELNSGYVRLIQAVPHSVDVAASDDVGLAQIEISYLGATLRSVTPPAGAREALETVTFTPPPGANGAPTVLQVRVTDTLGAQQSLRLVIEGRKPQAPSLVIASPVAGATLTEGSLGLVLSSVAADDTGVARVEYFLNGQRALSVSRAEANDISAMPGDGSEGSYPLANDPMLQSAIARLPDDFRRDLSRVKEFRGNVRLPPGFVALDPSRPDTRITLRAVATDQEGHVSWSEHTVQVVPDQTLPTGIVLRPSFGQDLVEGSAVIVEAVGIDNIFIEELEILVGPTLNQLRVIRTAGGFSPDSAGERDGYSYSSPVVRAEFTVPRLNELGAGDSAPYLIAVRVRDSAGNSNENELALQLVDIVRDREPAVSLISPVDGTRVVEQSFVTVTVSAEDDVAVTSVWLFVNGVEQSLVLRAPPFVFSVPVPEGAEALTIQAAARDSFNHEVRSQVVHLPVVKDQPPTVAIAEPRAGVTLTEGRDFAFVVAAQDDVGVTSVEAVVEGGIGGTLRLSASTAPYRFRVPLPFGSKDRTLTLRATARDTSGKEARAPVVQVSVQKDETPPVVSFLRPADQSEMVEGQVLRVEATADDNVGVVRVAFKIDGRDHVTMPAPPYAFSYRVPQAKVGSQLSIEATATDTSGLTSSSTVRVGVVKDDPPVVALKPISQMVAGRPTALVAEASDDVAVANVRFFVTRPGESEVEIGRRNQLPFEFIYTPDRSLGIDPPATLTFRASASDVAGQEVFSSPVSVTIEKDQPPTVAITGPPSGSAIFESAAVRLEADARDREGPVKAVHFFVDGRNVATSYAPAGFAGKPTVYAATFHPELGSGNRTLVLTAVAVDSADQETESQPVLLGTVQDTVPPEVDLVDPPGHEVVTEGTSITLSAAASDNATVSNVEFLLDGVVIGSTTVSVPGPANRPLFSVNWPVPTDRAGAELSFRAAAMDPSENRGMSATEKVEIGMAPAFTFDPFQGGVQSFMREGPLDRLLLGLDKENDHQVAVVQLGEGTATTLGKAFVDGPPRAAVLLRDLAVVATGRSGTPSTVQYPPQLTLIDLAGVPSVIPRRQGSVDLPGESIHGLAVSGHLAFVANGAAGVAVVDIEDPEAPVRLNTRPITGTAQDVAVQGHLLLVAGGPAGLRVHDLRDPSFRELSYLALPGEAVRVVVQGARAYVACKDPAATLAVVDLSQPNSPLLKSLLTHRPKNAALRATGLSDVAVSGNLAVVAASLVDARGVPTKGLLSVSALRPDGALEHDPLNASEPLKANLPRANAVSIASGVPLATFGVTGSAAFTPGRLVVTGVTPDDGAAQVAVNAPVAIEFSTPPAPDTVTAQSVRLRKGDATIGQWVDATLAADGRTVTITPAQPLAVSTQYFVSVTTDVKSVGGTALSEPFIASFKTRATANALPNVSKVSPPAGPLAGGTQVTIHGDHFATGVRVYIGNSEARVLQVAEVPNSIVLLTPPGVEGHAVVTVVNPDGGEASVVGGFVYLPMLQVSLVAPASGPVAGGTQVEVSGAGFQRGATVTFNGTAATQVRVLAPGRLVAVTPAGVFGPADVLVTNPDGERAYAPGAFLYSRLAVSRVIGRHDPHANPGGQSDHELSQGNPLAVVLRDKTAWVLSAAQVYTAARTPAELLSNSIPGGLGAVDVTTPEDAAVLGGISILPPYEPVALAIRGTRGFVVANGKSLPHVDVAGEGQAALLVFDLTQRTAPTYVDVVSFPGTAHAVSLVGDLALVAAGEAGLQMFSIANPDRPLLLGAKQNFLMAGVFGPVSVQKVTASGRHALIQATRNAATSTLLVDLATPGLSVLGELAGNYGEMDIRGPQALSAARSLRTVSLTPTSRPYVHAVIPPLMRSGLFVSGAAHPHVMAGITSPIGPLGSPASLQLVEASSMASPRSIDAIDLYPAVSLSGVDIDGDVAVATISATDMRAAKNALAVVRLPFPVVVASTPENGQEHVRPTEAVRLSFNVPVTRGNPGDSSIRLYELDGSAEGKDVTGTVSVVGTELSVMPADQELGLSKRYRLVVQGLREVVEGSSATGALMPGPYTLEFTTAAARDAVPMHVTKLSVREGPVEGGTELKIEGSGFSPGLKVTFNGVPAEAPAVSEDGTEVTLLTPPGVEGAATLELTSLSGASLVMPGAFLYKRALGLTSVSPSRGPTSGGTRVIIEGHGFAVDGQVIVRFNGVEAQRVRVLGLNRLEAYTPNGAPGVVDVSVQNPDGVVETLQGAFIYDAPVGASVALAGTLRDAVVIGSYAYVVGSNGLHVVDMSGVYTRGDAELQGLPIPPDRQAGVVDEDGQHGDDRIIGTQSAGDLWAVSYPATGGHRLFASGVSARDEDGAVLAGAIYEFNIQDPANPVLVNERAILGAGVFDVDARGDRLLAAATSAGFHTFDISYAPFPIRDFASAPHAQAVALEAGQAVAGVGTRTQGGTVTGGRLRTLSVEGPLAVQGELDLNVQRVRLRGPLAVVAAGSAGLVLVDVSDPAHPEILKTVDVHGFATDVRLVGSLAYVSAGAAGVAVVDVSNPREAQLLHHVTGAHAGSTFAAAVTPGGRVVSLRQRTGGTWSLDFGPGTELSVTSASVSTGDVVPLNLGSITVTLSTTVDPTTVDSAAQLTAGGVLVAGEWEAGSAQESRSTMVFNLAQPLPPDAPMRLSLSVDLKSRDGAQLVAPFEVEFWSAGAEGGAPRLTQVVPRVGPITGGGISELLGFDFDESVEVFVGGAPANVLARSSGRLTVEIPPGGPGLADVVVRSMATGLSSRREGGYLYTLPLYVESATPQFLNPRGGSTVDIQGTGFLPAWAHPLGSTQVRVRGIPATQVQVLSLTRMRAVAGPGSFGDAPVVVVSPDGIERSTAPNRVGYGLPFSGEEKALSVRPGALSRSPLSPYYIYASGGSSVSGNRFEQEYRGELTGDGRVPQSYRMAAFDVQLATRPRAAGAQVVNPDGSANAQIDRLVAVLQGRLPNGTPLPDVELMPDSLDVAISGDKLYVANGQSGLSVIDGRGTSEQPDGTLESLKLLGRAKVSSAEGMLASRVIPTPVGAWVLSNGLRDDPTVPPPNLCLPLKPMIGFGGILSLIDARNPADPVLVSQVGGGEAFQPYGATVKNGRLFVVTGEHQGAQYVKCEPAQPMPPVPYLSLDYGTRATYKDASALPANNRLYIYGSAGADAQVVGSIAIAGNLTDVVVHGDVAIVASAEFGLTFVNVANPEAPSILTQIAFDERLSNTPGRPQRLRLVGDVLFVSAGEGGIVLVDVSEPAAPVLLSGGNTEFALDSLTVGDRLLLAGKTQLTELETPFMLVTDYTPARGARVPPSGLQLVVQTSRPLAAPSVTTDSVRLLGPDGVAVPLDLSVRNNPGQLDYAIVAALDAPLQPEAEYRLQVDTTVTDQRGGALLVPLRTSFVTGRANAQQPVIEVIEPSTVSTAGGQDVFLRGKGLGGAIAVRLTSNVEATIVSRSDTELRVTLPPLPAGPIDVWVIDQGLPEAYFPSGLLALEPLSGQVTLSPNHGPVEGHTRVRLSMSARAVAPLSTVCIGDSPGVDVDIVDLSSIEFTTPQANGAGIATVRLMPPDESSPETRCAGGGGVPVGVFSYDLPIGETMKLPGFPPRVASDIKLEGDKLYVGVASPGTSGLEIFDVRLPERPLRLGGLATESPVRGLDVGGAIALLANDVAGLAVVDVTHPETPFLLRQVTTGSTVPGAGLATSVRIEGPWAYVSTVDSTVAAGNVQVFDASSPALPLLETVPLDADALALDLGPERLFALTSNVVGTQGSGLYLSIYDRQGDRKGRVTVDAANRPYETLVRSRLVVRANRAYVTVGRRLYVYDLSNLADIKLVQNSDLGSELAGLGWAAGTLFVSTSGQNTVQAVPPNELLPVGMVPASGSDARPDTHVRVDFTLPVLESSLTSQTATVSVVRAGQDFTAEGTWRVEYAVRGSSVVFTPSAQFEPGDVVTVTLNGLESFDLRPQASAFVGTFRVVAADALQPVIAKLEPSAGPSDQTTAATLTGSGFRPGTTVRVGGQLAGADVAVGGTSIAVSIPPSVLIPGGRAAGPAAVEVIDPSGLSARRLGGFVYRDPLLLSALAPNRSPQQGGTRVRLQGRGFAPGMKATFGGTDSFDVRVLSSQFAEATAPARAGGLVDVSVSLGASSSTLPGSFLYGAGAIARLATAPVRDVLVDSGVAYAALGATVDVHGVNGGPPLSANRRTGKGGWWWPTSASRRTSPSSAHSSSRAKVAATGC